MLLRKKLPTTAVIDGQTIVVEPGETLLGAALRQGVDFPSSCRVGGCGACKCKLASGEVKELTETGYLLTEQELDERTILACQSVPTSDVRIELGRATVQRAAGRVVAQERLTHDIVRVEVELDAPIAYRAGQFATMRLEGVDAARSYSFATPAREDGRVAFVVREVAGGALSPVLCSAEAVGRRVEVEGPHGDFWLREGEGPIVMVAGGSGLAPLLAMLHASVEAGLTRPITLLFGARTRRDLYALDEIEALARAYAGQLTFVPVLSHADDDATWTGARGLVTEAIAGVLATGTQAYLCGPPGMVDAAVEALRAGGVARDAIRFDRFTTLADAGGAAEREATQAREAFGGAPPPEAAPEPPRWTDALHYLKFAAFHAVGLFAAGSILAGGAQVTAGLAIVVALYVVGDALAGDDVSTPTYRHPRLLDAQLWLALPLLALIVFAAIWSVSPGDPLGFGAWVQGFTGLDLLAAREATTFGHHVSAWVVTGLMIGLVGTITAHELTHRTWDPVSMAVGRWLLAFSFDTSFAIEHVYGHHRYVSTVEDPATAPRGRNVYAHIAISTVRGNVSAWHIEARRLQKRRLGVVSWHNAFLRGHAMSLALVGGAWALGGWRAAAFFTACALWGKALLEIVNYMEHYGMVRNPRTPVQPRHSWNTNRRLSSWTMFNLTRHSHHHAQGEVPFHALRPYADAPMMIDGYLTTILVALVPPLWHRLMTPKVLAWDRDFATDEERTLAAEANARSGLVGLERRTAPRRALG